jgi:hypothetical protein
MKNLIFALAIGLTGSLAHASDLICVTPVTVYNGHTTIQVETSPGSDTATVTGSVNGGEAMFIRLISPITVQISHLGPEVAIFTNASQGFELDVSYQLRDANGDFVGSLTMPGGASGPISCEVSN